MILKGDNHNEKLLSIVLAAAMLAAVSVPSFAADKTLTSDHTSDTAKVITSTKPVPTVPRLLLIR